MKSFTLYGSPASTYVRTVRLLLEEKNLSYELKDVNFVTGENFNPDYKLLHPFNKMPVLREGKFQLYETIAICNYIERSTTSSVSFRPASALALAKMERLISCLSSYLFPAMVGTLVWQRIVEPLKGNEPDEVAVSNSLPTVIEQLEFLEGELSENGCFVEKDLTLFDLFLAPIFSYLTMIDEVNSVLNDLPRLKTWWAKTSALPSMNITA